MKNGLSFDPIAMDEAIRCAKVAETNVLSETDFKNLQSKLGNINEVGSISDVIGNANSIKEELSVIKNLPINLEKIKQEGLNSYLTETVNIGSYSKMGTFYDQTDPIYKNIKYGSGTLYSDGCSFFSLLSIITANTGKKFNYNEIKELAAIANEGIGLSNVERMENLATYLGNIYGFTYSKGPIDELEEALKNGDSAIAFTPNSTSSSGHIIPITGILPNGNIIVNDSWNFSEERQLRIDELGFNLNNGEIKLTVTGSDIDGDGRNDDLWYFNFKNKNIGNASNAISEVPKYYQSDYSDIKYGGGTIKSAGCGLVCLAMVDSYYNGSEGKTEREVIEELAKKYGNAYADKKTGRSSYGLFQDTSEELNLPYEEYIHYSNEKSFDQVVEKLKEGAVVVGLAKGNSIFTGGGHFVVLTGVTDDGNIIVNDPNKYNHIEFTQWPGKSGAGEKLTNGFENGFSKEEFLYGKFERFWVYSPKDGATTSNASTSKNSLSSFNNSTFSELLFKSDDSVSVVNLNLSKNETTNTLTTSINSMVNGGNNADINGTSPSESHLTAPMGHIDGPEAYETWYDLDMNTVVNNMEKNYGYTNVSASIRSDGVKVISGTAPDGTTFSNLVMVAADVRHDIANPNGTYERGQIVDTTLGKGIVVDACELAIEKRENNQGVHFDLATAWRTEPYASQAYSKENYASLNQNVVNVGNKTNSSSNSNTINAVNVSNSSTSTSTPNYTYRPSNSNSSSSGSSTPNYSSGSSSSSAGNSTPDYSSGSGSSSTIVTPPTSNIDTSITNILPTNKFSEALPKLSSGNLGPMEISGSSVSYEVFGVNNSTYGDYVQSLLDNGYVMSSDGSYIKGNYQVFTTITQDGNMSIKLIDISNNSIKV